MSTRKTTLFYAALISVASMAIGMVITSRLGLAPPSMAQSRVAPPMNSTPIGGPIGANTFRDIAEAQTPMVVNIRTESRQRTQELTDFFGGDELFRRFIHADNGKTWVIGPRIDIQDVLHSPHKFRVMFLGQTPRLCQPRFHDVFFSVCRTVSRLIESTSSNSTALSANNLSVHLLRPSGGGPQLHAISFASAFPSSLGCR